MHIDRRLETIANLVPQGCVLADIGTDQCGCWKSKKFPGQLPVILPQAPARLRALPWHSLASMSM